MHWSSCAVAEWTSGPAPRPRPCPAAAHCHRTGPPGRDRRRPPAPGAHLPSEPGSGGRAGRRPGHGGGGVRAAPIRGTARRAPGHGDPRRPRATPAPTPVAPDVARHGSRRLRRRRPRRQPLPAAGVEEVRRRRARPRRRRAFGYGDPLGEPELRAALVEYLAARVAWSPGATRSWSRRASPTASRCSAAPSWPGGTGRSRSRTRRSGGTGSSSPPWPAVRSGGGRRRRPARRGRRWQRTRAVLTTPAYHTPLGVSLAATRRAGLARWVAAAHRLVLEDDYDGELRFDRRPLRALQSLDPERIVYCGSASKALAPGLRLSWCVLPTDLVEPVLAVQEAIGGQPVSSLEQMVLAELLASGRYDAQVRRVRTEYRRRRDDLVAALADRAPGVTRGGRGRRAQGAGPAARRRGRGRGRGRARRPRDRGGRAGRVPRRPAGLARHAPRACAPPGVRPAARARRQLRTPVGPRLPRRVTLLADGLADVLAAPRPATPHV